MNGLANLNFVMIHQKLLSKVAYELIGSNGDLLNRNHINSIIESFAFNYFGQLTTFSIIMVFFSRLILFFLS